VLLAAAAGTVSGKPTPPPRQAGRAYGPAALRPSRPIVAQQMQESLADSHRRHGWRTRQRRHREVARAAPTAYDPTHQYRTPNVALFKKLPFDPVKDFAADRAPDHDSMVLLVRSDFQQRPDEFHRYARRAAGPQRGLRLGRTIVSIAKLRSAAVSIPWMCRTRVSPSNRRRAGRQLDFTFVTSPYQYRRFGRQDEGPWRHVPVRTPLRPRFLRSPRCFRVSNPHLVRLGGARRNAARRGGEAPRCRCGNPRQPT